MPVRYRIHTAAARFEYAITDRLQVAIGIPFATGSESREEDDGKRHTQYASGFGDIAVVGSAWLLDPLSHGRGNVRVGLGVKAPTGNNSVTGNFFTAVDVVRRDVDPAIQPGDGSWGAIVQVEGFRAIWRRLSAYGAGSYLSNPRLHTNVVIRAPRTGAPHYVSAADEYSAHGGLSYLALPAGGLSFSLGARVDGVPVRDLFGGSDTSFRRPGYAIYAEPTVSLTTTRGPFAAAGHTFSLSVPITVDQNRKASTLDLANGKHGGGDFARFLIFLGYSRRL
jgi:hypothetical protein